MMARVEEMCGDDLGHRDTARLVVDYLQRIIVHHGLWYSEIQHQFGQEHALELLDHVSRKSLESFVYHLGRVFGGGMDGEVPDF